MKTVVVILVIIALVLLALLAAVAARFARRSYQHYSGLEHQRGSAKQARLASVDRLKDAERSLVTARRELAERSGHVEAGQLERLRLRISTLADRLRYASYGYSPLGSPDPIREPELERLQQKDSSAITDAEHIAELARRVATDADTGAAPDLEPLRSALDLFEESLDKRTEVR
jgi:hypothetical protein